MISRVLLRSRGGRHSQPGPSGRRPQARPAAVTAAPAARSLLSQISFAGSLWGGCTHFGHKSRTKGLWLCRIRCKGTWETGGGNHHRAVVCPLAGLGLSVHWEVNKWRTSLLNSADGCHQFLALNNRFHYFNSCFVKVTGFGDDQEISTF